MLSHSASHQGTLPRSGPLHPPPAAPAQQDPDPDTLIQKTFGGKAVTTYRCLKCHTSSNRTETFTDIPLAFHDHTPEPKIATRYSERKVTKNDGSTGANNGGAHAEKQDGGDPHTLDEMLHHYMKPERLEGSNKYHCDTCGDLQDGERTVKITEAPEYLILTLLRFSFSIKTQRRAKILTDVKYPRTLYLPVCPGVDRAPGSMKRLRATRSAPAAGGGLATERFGLCSVVMHSGLSSDCGHYYCYARHSLPVEPQVLFLVVFQAARKKQSGLSLYCV